MTARATWVSGVAALSVVAAPACRDVSAFSTASGGHYEGPVVAAAFVRAGVASTSRMCLTIDTDHLQDAPGAISTSDGLFRRAPLRSVPQLWQDPLSTLSFGTGRLENVVYVASGAPMDGGAGGDVLVVLSFMAGGDVEVRLLRGAPAASGTASPGGSPPSLFAVFTLGRGGGSCPY